MKREDLEKIKLTKEQIDKVINLYHEEVTPIKEESEKTKAAYEKQKTELLAKEDKLKTTEEALKNFEGVNVSELKEKISALNKELEEKDKNYKTGARGSGGISSFLYTSQPIDIFNALFRELVTLI